MTYAYVQSERHTLVLSNTRELDRVSKYKTSILYTNYWWSVLHFFSPTLMIMCLPWGWYIFTMLCDIIVSRTFFVIPLHYMSVWLMWPWLWSVMSHLVFFAYVYNKEKRIETWNKINKEKEKKNRIRPSLLFIILTLSKYF